MLLDILFQEPILSFLFGTGSWVNSKVIKKWKNFELKEINKTGSTELYSLLVGSYTIARRGLLGSAVEE